MDYYIKAQSEEALWSALFAADVAVESTEDGVPTIESAIVSQPLYSFMDASGQHLFYSIGSTIRKLDLSGVNSS